MEKHRQVGANFIDALPNDGERRLMLAVLIDAIRVVLLQKPRKFQMYRDWLRERAWLMADNRSNAFSFVNICEVLGLDPGYVRRCVLNPPTSQPRARLLRYAAKAEDAWMRQRRSHLEPTPRMVATADSVSATEPAK